ncbi:hypothetical protein ASPVEDRAFT_251159 [Aspergillus versicolor CBS 583.65]|uniref:Uncharacterized protein n=1 Tax=Aspergillus versicolor CBS 583.65 TaxID=1036611 RepID=A0A1L9P5K7_ASPVE|nr:uncharacterized protein ASPVEDRAFT_251159 [Aspergillus versicolor CBS 583.65]OJI96713.1 hypothetical protein ASPVEDRAFT_251159 [Aspergillus versicolor CBS 583.65]
MRSACLRRGSRERSVTSFRCSPRAVETRPTGDGPPQPLLTRWLPRRVVSHEEERKSLAYYAAVANACSWYSLFYLNLHNLRCRPLLGPISTFYHSRLE